MLGPGSCGDAEGAPWDILNLLFISLRGNTWSRLLSNHAYVTAYPKDELGIYSRGLKESLRPQGVVWDPPPQAIPAWSSWEWRQGNPGNDAHYLELIPVLPLSKPQHVHRLRKGDEACLLTNKSPVSVHEGRHECSLGEEPSGPILNMK